MFLKPDKIEINSEEDFAESRFSGVDKLLNVSSYEILRFASSEDDERVSEMFYFIEDNAEFKESVDDFILYELDEKLFVLIDFNEERFIIVKKKDVEYIENMFDI